MNARMNALMDILITLWSEMMDRGIGLLLGTSVILVCTAIYMGARKYGENYFKHLVHKRNLCWLVGWLIALAALLLYFHFDVMSCCPVWLVLLMLLLFGLFTVAVFNSVSGPEWYLKRYEKWLREKVRLMNTVSV